MSASDGRTPKDAVSVKCTAWQQQLLITCEYGDDPRADAVRRFYVHARKALLDGLSPAENRTVPPLKHE